MHQGTYGLFLLLIKERFGIEMNIEKQIEFDKIKDMWADLAVFWRVWGRWLETFIKKRNKNVCSCNKVLTLTYEESIINL